MTDAQNVDPQEIAKFEALASRWWDRGGDFRPLHEINPLRANYIDENSPVAGRQLVDIGCGGGILAEAMARRGATVTGIDMGEAPLAVARLHQEESGVDVRYLQSTAEALALQDERKARIVEMRYFAGMTSQEIAEATETSVATIGREIRVAHAWLLRRMQS